MIDKLVSLHCGSPTTEYSHGTALTHAILTRTRSLDLGLSMTSQQSSSSKRDRVRGTPSGTQRITLESLPVELLAEILSELDLDSLTIVSCLSRKLRAVTADATLNPWRRPILHNLRQCVYDKSLLHLSVRSTVPQRNWIEILTFASPSFLLFDSTLPNLDSSEWEECFRRRFLPGWTKWKKDMSWRAAFMKVLYRVWHRSRSSCTADESWTKYVVLNRNGTLNEVEGASRRFNPLSIMHEMKVQNNLTHLPTQIRVVLQLMDVRILALGVINRPRTHFTVNRNAHAFLYPAGLEPPGISTVDDISISHPNMPSSLSSASVDFNSGYCRLSRPAPSYAHYNYPMYTPGGGDQRWHPDIVLGEGMHWVGGLMITVQLCPSEPHGSAFHELRGLELFGGIDQAQFASFTFQDFLTIAPWMEKRITKCIYGQGLGNH